MPFRLLAEFQRIFDGQRYLHRKSTSGDFVASHLYEDLRAIERSKLLRERIDERSRVLNAQNRSGINARRGDGTFGELIPNAAAIADPGYMVARGPVATVEIGCEVKILAKAMIKQIDRVIGDLIKQVSHFKRGAGDPICIGIVGINHATAYTSYEGDRKWPTDGTGRYRHPVQEASEAESRLLIQAKPSFDEFLILRFRASNQTPYPFEWLDFPGIELDYGAILTRIAANMNADSETAMVVRTEGEEWHPPRPAGRRGHCLADCPSQAFRDASPQAGSLWLCCSPARFRLSRDACPMKNGNVDLRILPVSGLV